MSIVALVLLAAMLVTYAVLDGYDLGLGAILFAFARTDEARGDALKSIGPFMSGNEVWLIASGGVLFAFFPRAYASSFSGFYLPFMVVLWLLIVRGIALELRAHDASPLWHSFWDWAFSLSSAALALILGVALGNLLRGLPLDATGNFTGSFATLLNPYALLIGFFALAALAQHGWTFAQMRIPGARPRAGAARALWLGTLVLDAAGTAATIATHPLDGPKLLIAGALGVIAFAALVSVAPLRQRAHAGGAFLASCAAIASLLGAAVVTLYPYLIPSSSASPGLTIFDGKPNGESLTVMVALVVIGLVAVYSYSIYVVRRLLLVKNVNVS